MPHLLHPYDNLQSTGRNTPKPDLAQNVPLPITTSDIDVTGRQTSGDVWPQKGNIMSGCLVPQSLMAVHARHSVISYANPVAGRHVSTRSSSTPSGFHVDSTRSSSQHACHLAPRRRAFLSSLSMPACKGLGTDCDMARAINGRSRGLFQCELNSLEANPLASTLCTTKDFLR